MNNQENGNTHSDEERANLSPSNESLGGEDGEAKLDEVNSELNELRNKCDKYLRTIAELENARRRMERERADSQKYMFEPLLRDLLPVLDGFDKAMVAADDGRANGAELKAFVEGVALVQRQLKEILGKYGLEEIKALGAGFDPNFHQAIQRIESNDVEQDTVDNEYAKGYLLNGRLVRPSMVSVKVPVH